MKTTTANSYRITQFKKELWIDMSTSCDSRFWSYSKNEKRLFSILVALLISLSLFYFNSYRHEERVVREQLEQYASFNADSLKRLQSATIHNLSTSPKQTDQIPAQPPSNESSPNESPSVPKVTSTPVPSGVVPEKSFEKKIDKKEVDEWIPQSKSSPKIITVNNAASSIAHAVTGNNATPLINALPRPPVHANDLAQAEIVNDEPVKSGENLILTTQLPK